ncbi:MAG TPA: NUDIX hydrolase [Candidatus Hydrogenedentes bacterium]|nr:NUDIX hydrolase [Candidatus Hydrogenedentota bacterium]
MKLDQITFRIVCSIVVRDPDGRILVVREGDPRVKGKINLPAGHLDGDETPAECAMRELEEETGLCVPPSGLLGVYIQSGAVNFVFHGRTDTTTTRLGHDVLACEWLSPQELEAVQENDILRPKKLRRIVSDLLMGKEYPVMGKDYPADLIQALEQEEWEKTEAG